MKKTNLSMSTTMAVMLILLSAATARAGSEVERYENSFAIEQLKSRIYFLSSDYLAGRVTDEPGYAVASEYVRSQFEAAGIRPFFEAATPTDRFYHYFNVHRNDYYTDAPIIVNHQNTEQVFQIDTDFKIIRTFTGGLAPASLPTVFVGYGIEAEDENWNDYKGLDIEGKNVLIMYGSPRKNGKPVLSAAKDELYNSKQGLNIKLQQVFAKKPAAIMVIADSNLDDYYNARSNQTQAFSNHYHGEDYRMSMLDYFYRLYLVKPNVAEAMLAGTPNDLKKINQGNLQSYAPGLIPQTMVNIPIRVVDREVNARNVIGVVEGTDPELKNEFIVIGAHLDHEPNFNGVVNNGADDNASGVTVMMELVEYFAAHPAPRSILFAAWTAEEGGCFGSKNFIETFPGDINQIKAAINFDCVGRNGKNAQSDFQTYILDAGTICPGMVELAEAINENTARFTIEKELHPRSGTSDHSRFIEAGIPVIDFFNGGSADLHKPTDDPDKIDFEYLQKMCILGAALTRELATTPSMPCP